MFQYISVKEQLLEEKAKTQQLYSEFQKTKSDLDYIAMMTEVDLDTEGGGEDEQEV